MNKISHFRLKTRHTQKQFAEFCGWKSARLSNYETGYRTPSIYNAISLVNKLKECGVNCSVEEVFIVPKPLKLKGKSTK